MNYKYKEMDAKECISFLKKNSMCIMSLCKNNIPYNIPMYYEYNSDSESEILIEMVSKSEGQKSKILEKNDNVTICVIKKFFKKSYSVICTGNVFIDDVNNSMILIRLNVKNITGRIYNS